MKTILTVLMALSVPAAQAVTVPELYCVSTKSNENVNQINVFTNKKGTMRINLQFYAVSDDGSEAGFFDTRNLQTITKLKYDSSTGVIKNSANKVALKVEKTSITPKQAEKMLKKGETGEGFYDFENPAGHKVQFSKYYVATMTEYNLPGKKGNWDRSLMDAFKAGVTEYVCGNAKDMTGPTPSIFDGMGDDSND